jgi:hypothetical protein
MNIINLLNNDFNGFNDLSKFNMKCENDYRKLITSVLKLSKSNNQFGGSVNNISNLNRLYPRISHLLSSEKSPIVTLPSISHLLNSEKSPKVALPSISHLLNSENKKKSQKSPTVALPSISHLLNSEKSPTVILPSISHLLNSENKKKSQKSPTVTLPSISHLLNSEKSPTVILPSISHLLNSENNNRSQKSTRVNLLNNNKSTVNNLLQELNLNNILTKSTENNTKNKYNQNSSIYQCKVFAYLNKKSKEFVDNSTCFAKCVKFRATGKIKMGYKENCILAITLEQIIKKIKNNTLLKNTIKIILGKIFQKIYQLHLLGVAHNNLTCSNIVVIRETNNIDIRFINFSKATILQSEKQIDIDFLQEIYYYYNDYLR